MYECGCKLYRISQRNELNLESTQTQKADKLEHNEPQADSMTLVGEEEGTREVIFKISQHKFFSI